MDELDVLFDGPPKPRPKGVRLRGSFKVKEEPPAHEPEQPVDFEPVDETSAEVAEALAPAAKPPAEPVSGDLEVDVRDRARQAAKAHDALSAAKAAYDQRRSRLQKKMDEELESLKAQVVEARTREAEAREALHKAMAADKVTRIPMKDRPDIHVKKRKGAKKGITKGWLVDAEGVAVKSYNKALAGEPEFASGEEFAKKIWDSQPKSEDTSEVIIPDPYEDEPDHG